MLELAKKIELTPEVICELEKLIADKEENIKRLAEKCIKKGFHCLAGKKPMLILAVILKLACDVKEKYIAAGIDDKIYYDTMSDIKIWCQRNNNKGLKNYGWLKNHVCFELFRLGRLQFQLYECKNKTLFYDKLPFSYGAKLLYVHIPEGEKLYEDKCTESLEEARRFFSRFFPDFNYEYFFCESWLLFDGNKEFMSEDSNIVRFMSLFEHCYSVKIDVQAVERIYGKRKLIKKNYSEKTTLQKNAKRYMLSGGKLGVGVGIIRK